MDIHTFAEELAATAGGQLTFAFHDLQTDRRIAYRADVRVPSASVIKLPLVTHVALAVAEGALSWAEPIALSDGVKVPGSGILKQLSAGLTLSLRDLCVLTIALSDNTATNMLIEHIGVAAVNARSEALGMPNTRLFRGAYLPDTPESGSFGFGATSADEMANLLVRIARRQIGDGTAAEIVLEMLAMQQDNAAIPRMLPDGWQYAGKTGSISSLRADVGLLTAPDSRRFALAAFVSAMPRADWSPDNPGLIAIARLARRLLAE